MTDLEKAKFIFDHSDACHLGGDCELTDCEKCCEEIWSNAINEVRADERAKVIDEFVKALERGSGDADWEDIDKHWILPIAEQLKEQSNDN